MARDGCFSAKCIINVCQLALSIPILSSRRVRGPRSFQLFLLATSIDALPSTKGREEIGLAILQAVLWREYSLSFSPIGISEKIFTLQQLPMQAHNFWPDKDFTHPTTYGNIFYIAAMTEPVTLTSRGRHVIIGKEWICSSPAFCDTLLRNVLQIKSEANFPIRKTCKVWSERRSPDPFNDE